MTDVIYEMAKIDVPEDLLDQINIQEILENFRNNFKQLDDLKNFRSEHEKRNMFSRLLKSGQLKDAQLNAQEVQAEFSKTVGQLMVISMLQSQKLEQQQSQLSSQQNDIQRQTSSLEKHTKLLEEQHKKLHEQSVALEDLVNQYFELRGLTQEGAKKLIAIATEVKNTKDDLISAFDTKMQETQELADHLEQQIAHHLAHINALFDERSEQLETMLNTRLAAFDERCNALNESLNKQIQQLQEEIATQFATQKTHQEELSSKLNSLADKQEQDKISVEKKSQQQQQRLDELSQLQQAQAAQLQQHQQDLAKATSHINSLEHSLTEAKTNFAIFQAASSDKANQLEGKLKSAELNFATFRSEALSQIKQLKIFLAVGLAGAVLGIGYIYHLLNV